MNRRATVAIAVTAVCAAGFSPALAASGKAKPKPLSGTFSYTDVTPDPTVVANTNAAQHCHGKLPASPVDVNSHVLAVKGRGLLTVTGHNALDWAMEVRDSKGHVLSGSDGDSPTAAEGVQGLLLPKAGKYAVVYCNAEGEPTVSASYKFVYR